MMELFIPPREGTPIHSSVREDFLFLHGSVHDASTARTVLVGVTSLALPTNLLNGLRLGGRYLLFFGTFLWKISSLFFLSSIYQLIVGFSSFGSFA